MRKRKPSTESETDYNLRQIVAALIKADEFPRDPVLWVGGNSWSRGSDARTLPQANAEGRLLEYFSGTDASDDDFNPERLFLMYYLQGSISKDKRGRWTKEHPSEFMEHVGRHLIASLLKSDAPIPREIRHALASLFEIGGEKASGSPREFKIQFRRDGKPRQSLKELQVSLDIAAALDSGELQKSALGKAMEKHGISRSEALRIWQNNRDAFIRLGWLKNFRRTRSKL